MPATFVWKFETYFGEKPALNEPVGSGLQIIPADLGAAEQAGYGDDLGLGEEFFAVGVDFANGAVAASWA